MIRRKDILIKRAISSSEDYCQAAHVRIDLEKSAIEESDGNEYVVLRSNSDVISAFLVNEWQVEELEPENWPDYLLDEAERIEA